jgi:hypothetical protein
VAWHGLSTVLSLPIARDANPCQQDPTAPGCLPATRTNSTKTGVVSITGFATAFSTQVPLPDALQIVNFNRECLVQLPLRQIWIPPAFLQTAIHAMPDVNRYFMPLLQLTEVILQHTTPQWLTPHRPGETALLACPHLARAAVRQRLFRYCCQPEYLIRVIPADETSHQGRTLVHQSFRN